MTQLIEFLVVEGRDDRGERGGGNETVHDGGEKLNVRRGEERTRHLWGGGRLGSLMVKEGKGRGVNPGATTLRAPPTT